MRRLKGLRFSSCAFNQIQTCAYQVVDGNRHFDQVDQASRRLLNALDGLDAHTNLTSRHEIEATERKQRLSI